VRIARLIAHPNVCRVFDIGEADGHVFLSMEYIDGEDLAAVLRRMGRPTTDKAIEIARQICLGLAAAHEAGMLHRDLKPANIMIDGRGRARITDFGLAGLADELAKGGEFAGTPAYMAPEQLAGGRVSARSDIYSLGLVLYELFTGKRAFEATSSAELKRMHESGTLTTPSGFARDIDPAIERLILHCLERDPETRPSSAYAVLGALPGGDPLAAAIAAGETPSPELVANAGERGTMSPLAAMGWIAVGLVTLAFAAGAAGPDFRALTQPSAVLSVRAEDVLGRTGAVVAPPHYSAEGFDFNQDYAKYVRSIGRTRAAKRSAAFFWRRWSPRLIESQNLHLESPSVNDPPLLAVGDEVVLLDPAGRLIGLRAIPADSVPAANGGRPAWSVLWAASGLDPAAFSPAPLARPVPAMCDSAAAWSGPVPWIDGERVTVQMGASRGRLSHFTVVHAWGTTSAPLDSLPADPVQAGNWGIFIFNLLPLVGGVVFGVRNLRAGRGDWRGATRIALFVFATNTLSALVTTNLSQVGLVGAGTDLVNGKGFAHSLMHAVIMWFAYVAVEPYVRRLWPKILVGWTRLISGRFRDPLVGRELLIGAALGQALVALAIAVVVVCHRLGLTRDPFGIDRIMLAAVTSLPATAYGVTYSGAVCVLAGLQTLVMLVIVRVLSRRTWVAVAALFFVLALNLSGVFEWGAFAQSIKEDDIRAEVRFESSADDPVAQHVRHRWQTTCPQDTA
jgi:serine/threonine-protein kinase